MSTAFRDEITEYSNIQAYYEKRYNTVCNIIIVASKNCSIILQIALSVFTTTLTLFFTVFLSSDYIAKGSEINSCMLKNMSLIYFTAILILLTGFYFSFCIQYYRQACYRKLESKISIDIASKHLGNNVYIRDKYYDILICLCKKHLWRTKSFIKQFLKASIPYALLLVIFLIIALIILLLIGSGL